MQMLRWPNIYDWPCWWSQRKLDHFPLSTGNYWQCRTKAFIDRSAMETWKQINLVTSCQSCLIYPGDFGARGDQVAGSVLCMLCIWKFSVRYFTCETSVKETLTWWNSQHHVSGLYLHSVCQQHSASDPMQKTCRRSVTSTWRLAYTKIRRRYKRISSMNDER